MLSADVALIFSRCHTHIFYECAVKCSYTAETALFRRLGCADIAMAQKRDGFVYPQCVYIVAEVDFKLAAEYVRNIAFAYIKGVCYLVQGNIMSIVIFAIIKDFKHDCIAAIP